MSTAGLKRWLPGLRATVIGIPYLWLLLFFAVPFLIVLMISFSLSRVGSPPYTWLLQYADGGFSLKLNWKTTWRCSAIRSMRRRS